MSDNDYLAELSLNDKPLGLDGWSSKYVKIADRTPKLRITAHSDTSVVLYVIWSEDGEKEGPIIEISLKPNAWRTEKIDVILTYMKIVVGPSSVVNNKTTICCIPVTVVPTLQMAHQPEQSEHKKRSKSPFSALKRRSSFGKLDLSEQKQELRDPRIPDNIVRNSLICGSAQNQISTLAPPPNDGNKYVLTFFNGVMAWELANQPWDISNTI
jgi:hypothetical protein